MAAEVINFKLTWENGKLFKFEEKKDDLAWKTIISAEENGSLPAIIDNLAAACNTYFNVGIAQAVNEMKKPNG